MVWLLSLAFANDGPSPQLFAEQLGQDVEVTMRLHETGEPGIGNEITLTRDGSPVFEDQVYTASDPSVATGSYCGGGDNVLWDDGAPIDCTETPEKCETCDDGVTVCPIGGCFDWYEFVEIDPCVPPGEHEWEIPLGWDTAITLSVTDEGDDCLDDLPETDTDTDTDADSDVDTDTDADTDADADTNAEDGCGGCDATGQAPGLALGLLMVGIGMLARRD